jgi:hypothetical protein
LKELSHCNDLLNILQSTAENFTAKILALEKELKLLKEKAEKES